MEIKKITPRRKIRVLIVDDSLLFRETMAKELSSDAGIDVVATASDPYAGRDKIIEFEPDIMVLDVEMPRMNGIEFLKRLMPQYPIPVVVVSSVSDNVFDALNAGAVDFVSKPTASSSKGMETFINELIIKVKIASTAKVGHWKKDVGANGFIYKVDADSSNKIIAIGASTGGTEALYSVIKNLPKDMPGILIVQHMPAVFTKMYADRLNNSCVLEVKEAQSGDKIYPGRVLIAAGDFHMKIKKGSGGFSVDCFKGEKVNGHCPSVDVLFESVAKEVGSNSIGVILTGMGADGSKGLLSMRKRGAKTIGQDEKSCVVYGMPKAAYDIGAVEKQSSLDAIPQLMCSLLASFR